MADELAETLERWRQRYYDSLAEFEAKERHWGELEGLLRRSISRLTLLADGVDRELDRQLDTLRNSIREEQDVGRIKRLVDAIFAASEQLQRQAAAPAPADAEISRAVAELTKQVSFPPGMGRAVKTFKHQLSKKPEDAAGALNGFARLVRDALAVAATAPDPAPTGAASGLPEPGTSAIGEVLVRFLSKLSVPSSYRSAVDALKQRAGEASGEAEYYALADELAALIARIETAAGDNTAPGGPVPADVLMQLLDSLNLPAEMDADVRSVRDRLEQGLGDDGVTQALKSIASLIAEVRTRAQRERQETEQFLKQLGERLQELDQQLHGADSVWVESRESSRQLQATMREEFSGIESSVKDAADLNRLKLEVHDRLEHIRVHMDTYRKTEEDRNQRAEAQIKTLTERIHNLDRETERLQKNIQQARTKALHDPLTGMFNRMAFDERVAQEYARWRRYHSPLALVLWDLDHFKKVNDTYGHKAGDKVLKTVARLFSDGLRASDFCARHGGEEFVFLLPEATADTAQHVAEKVRERVSNCGFHHAGDAVPITASCGIAVFREKDTPESVFERADKALYRAKQLGRNRCCMEDG